MSRKLATILAVLAGVVLLVVGFVAISIPSGSVATLEDGTYRVDIAMLTVPVSGVEPLMEAPDQFLGVPHPAPEFDTGSLGRELTFIQDTSNLPTLDEDRVLRAVYLGHDQSGDAYYIWHSGSPDLRQAIGQIIADFGAVGRLQSSYGTLEVGPAPWEGTRKKAIAESGLITGSISGSSDGPTTLTAEWHALPGEVAAVVLYEGEQPFGWQRPVSGTAAFQIDYGDQHVLTVGRGTEIVALTATGDIWNRQVLFPGQ